MADQYHYDEPNLNENNNDENPQDNGNKKEKEDKPVALNKVKAGLVLIVFLVILLFVVIYIRGCSVSKSVNSSQSNQNVQVEDTSNQNEISSTGEEEIENQENGTVENSSESGRVEGDISPNISDVGENEDADYEEEDVEEHQSTSSINNGDAILSEVGEPRLNQGIQSSAVVSSKSTFLSDSGSYVYEVDFLLLLEDDDYQTISYYCPKTTFDALEKGDSVNVEYQTDSTGNVSVSSVSR